MTGTTSHKPLPGPLGRMLAALWIVYGVGVVAIVTSSITSAMTVNHLRGMIQEAKDLPGHRVATMKGTLAAKYCSDQNLKTIVCPDLQAMVDGLVAGDADALVLDGLSLEWFEKTHPNLPISVVGPMFMKRGYGFALPPGSPLRHRVNLSLHKLQESGFQRALHKEYFLQVDE